MDKISALIEKLQELKQQDAPLSELADYTQLLYAELMCAKSRAGAATGPSHKKKVSVILPGYAERTYVRSAVLETAPEPLAAPELMAIPEPQAVPAAYTPEPVGAAVFEEIAVPVPREAAVRPGRELNEAMGEQKPSLNDLLKAQKVELATKLTSSVPVKDLTRALGINDKFLFINELFRGDRDMFDRSVKTINQCGSLGEAEYWIERELKIKLGWDDTQDAVGQFYALVRKRFS